MAEFHLADLCPCHTYNALLHCHAAASARYHDATTELVSLAGHGDDARFVEAKQNCEICLEDCKRTVAAMRAHKAAHRC